MYRIYVGYRYTNIYKNLYFCLHWLQHYMRKILSTIGYYPHGQFTTAN